VLVEGWGSTYSPIPPTETGEHPLQRAAGLKRHPFVPMIGQPAGIFRRRLRPVCSVHAVSVSKIRREELQKLVATPQEPGVAQAVATFEAVEQAYFRAVAAAPAVIVATSYATSTAPR
jgi:hypothetical protein